MTTGGPVLSQAKSTRAEQEESVRALVKSIAQSSQSGAGAPEQLFAAISAVLVGLPLSGRTEGYYSARGFDLNSGRPVSGAFRYDDPQTIEDVEGVSRSEGTSTLIDEEPHDVKGWRETAVAPRVNINDRVSALGEWMARDSDAASAFIADELYRSDLAGDWRKAIVFAAENAHFKTSEQQQKVRSRLRELAIELRKGSESGLEQVVWSALRRFASLLPSEHANDLLEFLDRDGPVDTRMVAMQCVTRLFEAAPPLAPERLDALSARVAEYAEKFLDPDVFSGGENSAIARNAIVALAALGSARLERCVDLANRLGRAWFSTRVRRELQDLLGGWKASGVASERVPVLELVDRILTRLE